MACLTSGVVANVVISTAAYVRLAGHTASRRTSAMPPIPNRRASWGTSAITPNATSPCRLPTEAATAGTGVDLRAANTAAGASCAEANAAVHSEICAIPNGHVQIERELLRPLPSLRLQIGAPSVLRKVDRL